MTEAPTGTVTFLFTDIEGSTTLWERHPDAMRDVLARHDTIVRDAIERNAGYVVKTTGDGAHAAFATAAAAAAAAVEGQRALAAEPWADGLALAVRMGLHTGSAQLRDGDYYGTSPNRAARVMAMAHGGQILCTEATAELLREDAGDLALLDLGTHRLRGLSRPERLLQIRAPGLATDFAALQSDAPGVGNVPPRATSFVARDAEQAEIVAALRTARLVTLTGPGGVGKTRLALEVADAVSADHRDGAWWCELAAADDEDALVQVVQTSLGASPRPGLSPAAATAEFLRVKDALLVLDNCEHLIDGAGDLATAVLRDAPTVRILATSREPLGLPDERVIRVRSLSLPESAEPDEIWLADAVRLFTERARSAGARLDPSAENAIAVAEICRRLDGIPLAIELAAARTPSMVPADIAGHLDERFRLLSGRRRGAVERHQTLRATVDWSYSLLTPNERRVFDAVGVFPGTFDAEAVEAVLADGGVSSWDVVDALTALVDKSMLLVDEHSQAATRYEALETLRQYSRERLAESDDLDPRRRAHAAHFADVAEAIGSDIDGPDELRGRRRLEAEIDNFRTAVGWALDRAGADVDLGIRVVTALGPTTNTGFSDVGVWATRALPLLDDATPAQRSTVLTSAGWNALNLGQLDLAKDRARAALRDGVDPAWVSPAAAYVLLGLTHVYAGDADEAVAVMREGVRVLAEDVVERRSDRAVLASAAPAVMAMLGDVDGARDTALDALALARETGIPTAIAAGALTVAVATWESDPDLTARLVEESIALTRAGAFPVVFGYVLAMQAQLRSRAGDRIGALDAARETIAFSHDKGDLPMLALAFDRVAQALTDLGEHELAARCAGVALDGPLGILANLPGAQIGERDRAVAHTRDALGPGAYDDARARGAALAVDEAVRVVLAELDRLRAG